MRIRVLVLLGLAACTETGAPTGTTPIVDGGRPSSGDASLSMPRPDATTAFDATPAPSDGSQPVADASVQPTPDATPAGCSPQLGSTAPPLSGTFVFTSGSMAMSPPALAGGDPSGTWVGTRVTVYLPALAEVAVDPAASTVAGSGWLRFNGSSYELALDVDVNVSIFGSPMAMPVHLRSLGTYAISGANLAMTRQCYEGAESIGTVATDVGFSQAGQFLFTVDGPAGRILLLFEGSRA